MLQDAPAKSMLLKWRRWALVSTLRLIFAGSGRDHYLANNRKEIYLFCHDTAVKGFERRLPRISLIKGLLYT